MSTVGFRRFSKEEEEERGGCQPTRDKRRGKTRQKKNSTCNQSRERLSCNRLCPAAAAAGLFLLRSAERWKNKGSGLKWIEKWSRSQSAGRQGGREREWEREGGGRATKSKLIQQRREVLQVTQNQIMNHRSQLTGQGESRSAETMAWCWGMGATILKPITDQSGSSLESC